MPRSSVFRFAVSRIASTLLIFAAAGLAQTPRASSPAAHEQLQELERATELISQHNFSAAEDVLKQILERNPKEARAIELRGVIHAEQGENVAAEDFFRQSIAADPALLAAHENLAALLVELNRPDEAFDQFEAALALNAKSKISRNGLVQLAEQQAIARRTAGDGVAAVAILQRAIKSLPDEPRLQSDMGILLLQQNKLQDALSTLEAAHRLAPDDAKTLYGLARTEMELQQMPPAEKYMREYLAMKPEDATAHYGLGRILAMQQRPEEAQPEFQRSIELKPQQVESYYELGQIALDSGNLSLATQEFDKAIAVDPRHGGALTGLGAVSYRRKDYPEAILRLQLAIENAPNYGLAHYYLGLSLARSRRKDESERELKIAADLDEQQQISRTQHVAPGNAPPPN
jgi:tetratricopeptide (TPR) repeat protein